MYSNIVTCTQLIAEPGIAVINAGFWDGYGFRDYFPDSNADTEYFDEYRRLTFPCYFMNMNWYRVNQRADDPYNKIQNNSVPLSDCGFCWPDRTHRETVTQYVWLDDLINDRRSVYGMCWFQIQRPNIVPTLIEGKTRFRDDDDYTYWKIQILGQEYPYPSGVGNPIDVIFTQYLKVGRSQVVDTLKCSFSELRPGGGAYYAQYGKGIRIPAKVFLTNNLIGSISDIPPVEDPVISEPPVDSGNQDNPPPPPVDSGNQDNPPPPPVDSGNQEDPPPPVDSGNQSPPPDQSAPVQQSAVSQIPQTVINNITKEFNTVVANNNNWGWLVIAGVALGAFLSNN